MTPTRPVAGEQIVSSAAEPLPWDEMTRSLAAAESFWLATVRPDGCPHVRPILAVWVDEALYFTTSASSPKSRLLARNPHCALSAGTSVLDLMVEGEVVRVFDGAAVTWRATLADLALPSMLIATDEG